MNAHIHIHNFVGLTVMLLHLFLSSQCDCDSFVSTEFLYYSRSRGVFILHLRHYSYLLHTHTCLCIYNVDIGPSLTLSYVLPNAY
jgi:hypothetical protein